MVVRALLSVIIGLIAYFVAGIFLAHNIAALIGLLVGLVVFLEYRAGRL